MLVGSYTPVAVDLYRNWCTNCCSNYTTATVLEQECFLVSYPGHKLNGLSMRPQWTMQCCFRPIFCIAVLVRLSHFSYYKQWKVVVSCPAPPPAHARKRVWCSEQQLGTRLGRCDYERLGMGLQCTCTSLLTFCMWHRVWRENRHALVGWFTRFHEWHEDKWVYRTGITCQPSFVLTGAVFFHKVRHPAIGGFSWILLSRAEFLVFKAKNCHLSWFYLAVCKKHTINREIFAVKNFSPVA